MTIVHSERRHSKKVHLKSSCMIGSFEIPLRAVQYAHRSDTDVGDQAAEIQSLQVARSACDLLAVLEQKSLVVEDIHSVPGHGEKELCVKARRSRRRGKFEKHAHHCRSRR